VGQEPDEIERDIEATRARLAVNVDALAERIHPGNVVRRTAETARGRIMSLLGRDT
jgi:hypothetical protein